MRLFLLALCVPVAAADAQVAYTSLRSDGTHGLSFYSNWLSSNLRHEIAWSFEPGISGEVASIRLGLYRLLSGGSQVQIGIYAADQAASPSALLWSQAVTPPMVPGAPQTTPAWTLPVLNGPSLEAGSLYYLSVQTLEPPAHWTWYASQQGPGLPPFAQVTQAERPGPGAWSIWPLPATPPAYEIVVPAPATFLILGGLGIARRRRRPCGPDSRAVAA